MAAPAQHTDLNAQRLSQLRHFWDVTLNEFALTPNEKTAVAQFELEQAVNGIALPILHQDGN